jgi:dCMP deaminase
MLSLAKEIASWSKDPSTKCGAVLCSRNMEIISLGFNGFPRGADDSPELYEDRAVKLERVIHAEMNAILSARRDLRGSMLYTWPMMPCQRCAAHIIQAGICRVVAPEATQEQTERWGLDRSFDRLQESCVICTIVPTPGPV